MLIAEQPAVLASQIVDNLNGKRTVAVTQHKGELKAYLERLNSYAKTWVEAGYRLEEWSMKTALEKDILTMHNFLLSRPDGQPFIVTLFHPQAEARDKAQDLAATEGRLLASQTFAQFLTSPHYAHIGQCAHCEKWFFNKSGKRTRYCSVKCARLETSSQANAAARERNFLRKLERVQNAIKAFDHLPKERRAAIFIQPDGWKGWVAQKAGHEVTTTFITRVVNAKRLKPPKGVS